MPRDLLIYPEASPSYSSRMYRHVRIFVLAHLGAAFLRLLNATLRWTWVGFEGRRHWGDGEPQIVAFWHGRQLLMPWAYLRRSGKHRRQMYALSSEHSDGRIMAKAMGSIGVDSIAGSSSNHGRRALAGLIAKLRQGHHVAMTPDGPRGPAGSAKAGTIALAMHTGAPIIPAAFSAKKRWCFSSWDGMMLPKPFSRAVYLFGKPIYVPAGLSAEETEHYRVKLERAIEAITIQADRLAAAEPRR